LAAGGIAPAPASSWTPLDGAIAITEAPSNAPRPPPRSVTRSGTGVGERSAVGGGASTLTRPSEGRAGRCGGGATAGLTTAIGAAPNGASASTGAGA
jgi:hypothetical protein